MIVLNHTSGSERPKFEITPLGYPASPADLPGYVHQISER